MKYSHMENSILISHLQADSKDELVLELVSRLEESIERHESNEEEITRLEFFISALEEKIKAAKEKVMSANFEAKELTDTLDEAEKILEE